MDGEASDFRPQDPGFVRNPYAVFDQYRSAGRALRHADTGMWLAFRHADADAVLRSRSLGRIFTTREPADVWDTFNWLHADSILDSEPPKHTRLRALVAKAFARGHVERLRPRVRELASGLLDEVEPGGRMDVITDYAEPLPVMVIAELLGIPEDERAPLRPWSQDIVRMYEYERTDAQEARARRSCDEFATYVVELAARRRAAPEDDLVTHLVQVEEAGEKLDERELVATCVLLLNAGHEASVNVSATALRRCSTSPSSWTGTAPTRGRWPRRQWRSSCGTTRRCSCSSASPAWPRTVIRPPATRSSCAATRVCR